MTALFGENGILGRANESKWKTEMKAYEERANIYVLESLQEKQKTEVNAGYENLDALNYYISDTSDTIETILPNTKETYKSQIVIYKGEFYYIPNPEDRDDERKQKWCKEINIKIWGIDAEMSEVPRELPDGGDIGAGLGEGETYEHDGSYRKVNGIWMCIPDLTGFYQLATRYVKWDASGIEQIGTWTVKKPDRDWYDYIGKRWANVMVEYNGHEAWYIWIPRYAYKINGKDNIDIRFIDKNNIYKDPVTDAEMSWAELQLEGYTKVPESFYWGNDNDNMANNTPIAGYWFAKYQMSDITKLLIDMTLTSGETNIRITDIILPSSGGLQESKIAKYKFYVNAQYVGETINRLTPVNIGGLQPGTEYTINVTAEDEYGQVLASCTRTKITSVVEPPDLTGFNKNTTFYVWWDEQGNERNETPITKAPPEEWYSYADKKWANIVTRNNGKEAYYIWIPRYQYRVANPASPVAERYMDITFIKKEQVTPDSGYQIPESFYWGNDNDNMTNNTPITGYWFAKHQASNATAPTFDVDVGIRNNSIKISNIRQNTAGVTYYYYLDGELKHTGTGEYTYEGLQQDKMYTINIIAKKAAGEYVNAFTREVITVGANSPDLTGFNTATTYYLTYDSGGNEVLTSINNSPPSDWYDYADKKWANIVTTNTDGSKKAYWIWIPRYAYKPQYADVNVATAYMDIVFLRGTSETVPLGGYQIPESFYWGNDNDNMTNNTPLTGYWFAKYQVSN